MAERFSLSTKQASRLEKMLPRTRRTIDHAALVAALEKIGNRYQQAVARLGCQPTQETLDRFAADPAYGRSGSRDEERSWQQNDRYYSRVLKADQELIRLCTKTARVWKEATGRKLTGWSGPEGEETEGHRRAVASKHPLGLMLHALGVYVAVASIDKLANCGRRRADGDPSIA